MEVKEQKRMRDDQLLEREREEGGGGGGRERGGGVERYAQQICTTRPNASASAHIWNYFQRWERRKVEKS